MTAILLLVFLAGPFDAHGADDPVEKTDCEAELEGANLMRKLAQDAIERDFNRVVAYRIRVRIQNDNSFDWGNLELRLSFFPNLELKVSGPPGSSTVLEYQLAGSVRDVVRMALQLADPQMLQEYNLRPISWRYDPKASKPIPAINPALDELLRKKIIDMNFSPRTQNALLGWGNEFVGDVVTQSERELFYISNFGPRSFNEVKEAIEKMGLHLEMEVPGWPFPDLEHSWPNRKMPLETVARVRLDQLQLPNRVIEPLKWAGIIYLGDLVTKSEYDVRQKISKNSTWELKQKLNSLGLRLNMKVPGWPYSDLERL